MTKLITFNDYLSKAENGARVLFDFYGYRLLDGIKGETASYFIMDLKNDKTYEISLSDAYELIACYCAAVDRYVILNTIEDLICKAA
ncbi:hypothetical protein ACIQZG_23790 [Lysinibacillus sp. NPDC096418]|uniref:hypothetical protein n=1 Tax=Lysinibacillus sp. NPDC096418 TaxID=3364138 RepID=UPI003807B65C